MAETENDIKLSIISFVNKNFLMGTQSIKFNDDDSFLEKGIVDSTGVLELVNYLQNTYKVRIEDKDLLPENLDSVNRIAAFIKRKKYS